jgi:hypothetical protein
LGRITYGPTPRSARRCSVPGPCTSLGSPRSARRPLLLVDRHPRQGRSGSWLSIGKAARGSSKMRCVRSCGEAESWRTGLHYLLSGLCRTAIDGTSPVPHTALRVVPVEERATTAGGGAGGWDGDCKASELLVEGAAARMATGRHLAPRHARATSTQVAAAGYFASVCGFLVACVRIATPCGQAELLAMLRSLAAEMHLEIDYIQVGWWAWWPASPPALTWRRGNAPCPPPVPPPPGLGMELLFSSALSGGMGMAPGALGPAQGCFSLSYQRRWCV